MCPSWPQRGNRGTRDYAGLTFFELDTGKGGTWTIQGQVFPGDPPPPYSTDGTGTERPEAGGPVADDAVAVVTGTATCPTADLGTRTTDADGVTHYRDGTFRCAVTTDDARASGTDTATWNADVWGDTDLTNSALVEWGTSRLENDGWAWEGNASGVYSSDRGDIIAIWYTGTGGYAGLSYFELWTGQQPWKIQGQIFRAIRRHPRTDRPARTLRPDAAGLALPLASCATAFARRGQRPLQSSARTCGIGGRHRSSGGVDRRP